MPSQNCFHERIIQGNDMSKCIWYISKYARVLKNGPNTRHFYLAREFKRRGFHTVIIASDSSHTFPIPTQDCRYYRDDIDGVESWRIQTHKYQGANSLGRILSWLDFEFKLWRMPKRVLPNPDVVIVSSLSLLTVFNGYLLKRKYGCKLIFEVRDIWPLTIVEEGGFSRWNPFVLLLAWAEKFGYRHADVIVGTMPNLREHVMAVMRQPMNCACVPFGYDPVMFEQPEPLPPGYEEQYIPKGKFIIGYAGAIGLTNALEPLFDCAEKMQDNAHIHFLLVGGGGLLETYKAKYGNLPNLSFAPKVAKTQVQAVLKHCDLLYFSVKKSKVWDYGLSLNKLIDYMMAAKPIVASYSGYPSMINEAQCGVFVPADDVPALRKAIEKYAEMPSDEIRQIGLRGRDWLVANRPYRAVSEQYLQLMA